MMRRGPLADNPIDTLLVEAARDRTNGVLELHANVDGLVYLVDGEIYLAELDGQPPLDDRLVAAGLLSEAQVREHGVRGETGVYLARALDTDATIDEDAIDAYLLDATAATLARFVGATEGEYELDPYGAHVAGVLSSWTPDTVMERVDELRAEAAGLEAERVEEERIAAEQAAVERAEAERLEAERLAEVRLEAERVEAERAEAARLEAERLAELQTEAERFAAEQAAQAEPEVQAAPDEPATTSEQVVTAESSDQTTLVEDESGPEDAGVDAAIDISRLPAPPKPANLPEPPVDAARPVEVIDEPPRSHPSADALVANNVPIAQREVGGLGEIGAGVLLVVPDDPPEGIGSIELSSLEWKVVVLAAQGDSLGGVSARLGLDLDETRAVVDRLWGRGLVATIGPGGPQG